METIGREPEKKGWLGRMPLWQRCALWGCLAIFFVSGGLLVRDLLRSEKEQAANQQLAGQVQAARQAAPALAPAASGSGPSELLQKYQELYLQNADLAGWLSIEDTPLDYPVMYTPQEPEYYLRRAFDGSYAISGTPFVGAGCKPDGSHVIIYGHNMSNETMFGSLKNYARLEYALQHPVVRFDTLEAEGEYQVLAAFYSRIYAPQEQGFRYYDYTDLSEREQFEEYLQGVRASALYDTGVTAEFGDQLLTLSTCSSHTDEGRFVLVAKRV